MSNIKLLIINKNMQPTQQEIEQATKAWKERLKLIDNKPLDGEIILTNEFLSRF